MSGKEMDENKKMAFGAFLLIIGLFSTAGAGVLAFLGMNDDPAEKRLLHLRPSLHFLPLVQRGPTVGSKSIWGGLYLASLVAALLMLGLSMGMGGCA